MTLIVEDGSGVTGANAYVDEDYVDDYFDTRDGSDWNTYIGTNDTEAAIIRATTALDNLYRYQYPGYRTLGRSQELEWPRTEAFDYEGLTIATDEIPTEVKQATAEFAVRELLNPGSIQADLEQGGNLISSLRAGSVAITYAGANNPNTVYQIVDSIISKLLGPMLAGFEGTTVRS